MNEKTILILLMYDNIIERYQGMLYAPGIILAHEPSGDCAVHDRRRESMVSTLAGGSGNTDIGPGFCARQHVCSTALSRARLESPARARWLLGRIDIARRRYSQRPLCLNSTLPSAHAFGRAAAVEHSRALGVPGSKALLHAVFIDDRKSPNFEAMWHVARMGNGSHMRFLALVPRPKLHDVAMEQKSWLADHGFDVIYIDEASLPQHIRCVHWGLRRMVTNKKLRYAAMLQPLVFWILPRTVRYALVLDTDLVPLRPLDALLAEVPRMRSMGALLGLVVEQSRFYTMVNRTMPMGVPGFNGGIELHDLVAMRRSRPWMAAMDAWQGGLLFDAIGFSGEQNLYNGLAALFPHLVYPLGCQWNRQMASWGMVHPQQHPPFGKSLIKEDLLMDSQVHSCAHKCAVLHFNGFKCAARIMWNSSGSCNAWRGLLDRLARGDLSENEGSSCPDKRMQRMGLGVHELVRPMNGSRAFLHRMPPAEHSRALALGFKTWFGNCCREDP